MREDDIIVTANRYGEARVAAETEFSEEEITAQGTDNMQDLITRLTPFIGNGEEEPISSSTANRPMATARSCPIPPRR